MTDEERMSFWKAGEASRVLRFTNPYAYEDCIIGVSTDGRAVYDYLKALEYIYEKEKGEDGDRDTIMMNAADMINHDVSLHNPADKIPVFVKVGGETDDDELYINDNPYSDFSFCTIGPDFREDRYIYSLKEMVNYLMVIHGMEKDDAVRYVYLLEKAGTVEEGRCHYIIVDDLYEHISLAPKTYQEKNGAYSPEFEENCLEFEGSSIAMALAKLAEVFKYKKPVQKVLNSIQIKKTADTEAEVCIDATEGSIVLRANVETRNNAGNTEPFLIYNDFAAFIYQKISENDTVKLFQGNGCVFIKINDDLYSSTRVEMQYPSFENIIPEGYPYKAEIKTEQLSNAIQTAMEEKGISARFNPKALEVLKRIYEDTVILEMKDAHSPVKFCMDGVTAVIQPVK